MQPSPLTKNLFKSAILILIVGLCAFIISSGIYMGKFVVNTDYKVNALQAEVEGMKATPVVLPSATPSATLVPTVRFVPKSTVFENPTLTPLP